MEATKTYSIGKTNSFSGRSAAHRQLKPDIFFTGCSSSSFSVMIMPLIPNTKISNQEATGSGTLNCFAFAQQVQPVNFKIPEGSELNSRPISVNKSTSIYKSFSGAHWAYCLKLKKTNKFDCTITPTGRLKHCKFSENHDKGCTLGEAAALPDFPLKTSTSWNADGKKPISGA